MGKNDHETEKIGKFAISLAILEVTMGKKKPDMASVDSFLLLGKCKRLTPSTSKSVSSFRSYNTLKTRGQNWNRKWNRNGVEWDEIE